MEKFFLSIFMLSFFIFWLFVIYDSWQIATKEFIEKCNILWWKIFQDSECYYNWEYILISWIDRKIFEKSLKK